MNDIFWPDHTLLYGACSFKVKDPLSQHQLSPRLDSRGRDKCWMRYMVCAISVRRVMWLPALYTWLSKGAEDSSFFRTMKNRGIFREFCLILHERGLYLNLPVFSVTIALQALETTPTIGYLNRALWSIFEFLVCDFPKTSCTCHIVRSILPFIIYSCYH